jgi:hypothetical protein
MLTRRARLRRKIYSKLPKWFKTHDFEVFASLLGILGGLPLVFGQVSPTSVESVLPRPIVEAWGIVLVGGCIAILGGILVGASRVYPERIIWMRLEAIGLTALAYFCYIYTVCICGVNFENGWTAGLLILAFGVTCHVREASINIELEQYRLNLGLEERA